MAGNPYHNGTRQGPLPLLLIALTVLTGVVDGYAFLALGHVFVANMTGTVLVLGLALAGATSSVGRAGSAGMTAVGCLLAITSFGAGAVGAGRLALPLLRHRGHLLAIAAGGQLALLLGATVLAAGHGSYAPATRAELIVLLALGMGIQHAAVRRLGVPDLGTGGLTRALTVLATGPAPRRVLARRVTSVVAMLAGALLAGLASRLVTGSAPLFLASALLAGVVAATERYARQPGALAWAVPQPVRPLAPVRALPAARTPAPVRPVLPAAPFPPAGPTAPAQAGPADGTPGPSWRRAHPDATSW